MNVSRLIYINILSCERSHQSRFQLDYSRPDYHRSYSYRKPALQSYKCYKYLSSVPYIYLNMQQCHFQPDQTPQQGDIAEGTLHWSQVPMFTSKNCSKLQELQTELFREVLQIDLQVHQQGLLQAMELQVELFVETLQRATLTEARSHVIQQELLQAHEVAGRALQDASQVQGAPQLRHTSDRVHLLLSVTSHSNTWIALSNKSKYDSPAPQGGHCSTAGSSARLARTAFRTLDLEKEPGTSWLQ